jgi:hypothetical protein
VDVLHVFFSGAGVAEALLTHGAAVPARVPAAVSIFFCCVTDPDESLFSSTTNFRKQFNVEE